MCKLQEGGGTAEYMHQLEQMIKPPVTLETMNSQTIVPERIYGAYVLMSELNILLKTNAISAVIPKG